MFFYHVFRAVAELEFLRPIHLFRGGIVARRRGPADEFDRGVALLLALGAARLGPGAHFLEQVVVVDFGGVVVFHVALFLVADDDGPRILRDDGDVGGDEHSERFRARGRVAPDAFEDGRGVVGAEVAKRGRELEFREVAAERDLAFAIFQRSGELLDFGERGFAFRVVLSAGEKREGEQAEECGGFHGRMLVGVRVKQVECEMKNRRENFSECLKHDDHSDEPESRVPQHLLVFRGGGFAEEKERDRAAIERREREQVQRDKDDLQREGDAEQGGEELPQLRAFGRIDDVGEVCRRRYGEDAPFQADVDEQARGEDDGDVRGGAGHRHPRGAPGIASRPVGIVRRAGPADHAVSVVQKPREDGDEDHAEGLAFDVRGGVERNLTAAIRGVVAETQRGPCVAGLVEHGGIDENEIPNQSFDWVQ